MISKGKGDMLPSWNGADSVYSKAYGVLEWMGQNGHVEQCGYGRRKKCFPSEEMVDLIDALNRGEEESIKGLLMIYRDRFPQAFDQKEKV